MMMTEQMQARAHGREDFVDDRLARVDAPALGIKRPRRLVCEKDVDILEHLACEHLVAYEVTPFIVAALTQLERFSRPSSA